MGGARRSLRRWSWAALGTGCPPSPPLMGGARRSLRPLLPSSARRGEKGRPPRPPFPAKDGGGLGEDDGHTPTVSAGRGRAGVTVTSALPEREWGQEAAHDRLGCRLD